MSRVFPPQCVANVWLRHRSPSYVINQACFAVGGSAIQRPPEAADGRFVRKSKHQHCLIVIAKARGKCLRYIPFLAVHYATFHHHIFLFCEPPAIDQNTHPLTTAPHTHTLVGETRTLVLLLHFCFPIKQLRRRVIGQWAIKVIRRWISVINYAKEIRFH